MRCNCQSVLSWAVVWLLLICVNLTLQAKNKKSSVVTDVTDNQQFKKTLKLRNNVLVLFINKPKEARVISEVFRDASEIMKGQATLISIVCSNNDSKKLCKKQKVPVDQPYHLRHYKDGYKQIEYDRAETVSAMTNFLRDPSGDLPWEEDPEAADVYHIPDEQSLNKFIKKGAADHKKSMIMFFAPWCTYCTLLKPEYVKAATTLKNDAYLAAIDLSKPTTSKLRSFFNISGFPTLLYYEYGKFSRIYNGDNNHKDIVSFMKDPEGYLENKEKKMAQLTWSEDMGVTVLTSDNFNNIVSKVEHALVVFYAPWCGHCKNIKPEYKKAAANIAEEKLDALLGAVDATKQKDLVIKYNISSYPTIKYFNKGEFQYDVPDLRTEDKIVSFLKKPGTEQPPPPEVPWEGEGSAVRHLNASLFNHILRTYQQALVMFYGPGCAQCESAKAEFVKAAANFVDSVTVMFATVDCESEGPLCEEHGIDAYPTIHYFSFNEKLQQYTEPKNAGNLVKFIRSQYKTAAQAAGFGVNVEMSDDSNFETIVEAQVPTFAMFYAAFCGHCSTVKPAISRLATTMLSEKSVRVIAIDVAKNPKVADLAQIQTLPTFKIYSSGKELAVYEGDRSYEDMLKFCQSYVKVNDEL